MTKEINKLSQPRIIKVVINIGVKEGAKDENLLTKQLQELASIAGQKPKICRAKKSIAGFKLGKGMPIGLKVTLRKKRMHDFLQKLFTIVLPRVRDFRGLTAKGFDGCGNFTLGIKEQTVFPETEYSKTDKIMGLEVTIVTSTDDNSKAQDLLMSLGAPFVDDKGKFVREKIN